MKSYFNALRILEKKDSEPKPDTIRCYECHTNYPLTSCGILEEGDWETGYYKIHVCPVNADHEVDYEYSPSQIRKHMDWESKQLS